MAPTSSKTNSKDKHSHHHRTGSSSSRHHRNPASQKDNAEFSSRQEATLLNSAFFKDDTVMPAPLVTRSHHSKESKPSKYETSKKQLTSHNHHYTNPVHQDRHTNPSMKYEEWPEKSTRCEKPEPKIKFKTAFTDPRDIEMAEKQIRLKTLKPDELEKQHKWAQEKLQSHGLCPAGYKWWEYNKGVDEAGNQLEGYRCYAGNHLVTHELLAEAKGGCYVKHRIVLAALQAAHGGRSGFSFPGPLGNQMMPQYRGAFNPLMPGYGGGHGSHVYPNYPSFQPVPPHMTLPDAPRPAPPGYRTWYGPDYSSANNKDILSQRQALLRPSNPYTVPGTAVKPIPDEFQQGPPAWLLNGD
ncbi:hypothetical protein BKA64DRAFT_706178 [Cadophora sp. MPI-SDFR-AT-0126]|nr:hypothetical protein BKA64DRAFT_706178 [Leotiomycetes sp. MPI-SDFR-AT-0126]